MLALLALAVAPAWTVWHEVRLLTQPAGLGNLLVSATSGVPVAIAAPRAAGGWLTLLGGALPWLVLGWACGVLFLGLHLVRQWRGLRAIVRTAAVLPVWEERAQRLGRRVGLGRAVRVLASVQIATPTLVGWVRPVVVPLAMLARMPSEQLELILAHELAHLRRLDHLANLFQVVLETLLFYHPVVHWISRDARNERELCCDALALRASGGSRRDFVVALAGMEEFRAGHADLALAASGGVLVERASFIAGAMAERRSPRAGLMAMAFALFGVVVVLGVAWQQDAAQPRVDDDVTVHAVVLRGGFAAGSVASPAAVWHAVVSQRPRLAPVALIPASALLAKGSANAPAVPRARVPALMVPDLAVSTLRLAPVAAPVAAPVQSLPAASAAPRAIRIAQPAYPPQALLNGLQGQVEIQFALNAGGVPQDLQVVGSSASGQFDAAALVALSRWRFAPPAEPGRRYRQIFTFRLGDATGAAAGACLVPTGTHICRRPADITPNARVMQSND